MLATDPQSDNGQRERGGLIHSCVYLDSCTKFNQMVGCTILTDVYESK